MSAAAARQHDDDVTLNAGQEVRLKTFFYKDRQYLVTVSGVVTLTVSNVPITIDPLFSYSGNCQNPSPRVGVRLLDSRRVDVFSPFSGVPAPKCRSDHTYRFTLNGSPPRTGVLTGPITAKNDITLNTARGDTASGSFTLTVRREDDPRRDVTFKVRAKKEFRESAMDPLLADARLSGIGRIADLDGARTARGRFQLTLVWLTRDDTVLTLSPTGDWSYSKKARSVRGSFRVVRSSDGTCLKPREPALSLNKRSGAVGVYLGGCNGLDFLRWRDRQSDLTLSVEEVRIG